MRFALLGIVALLAACSLSLPRTCVNKGDSCPTTDPYCWPNDGFCHAKPFPLADGGRDAGPDSGVDAGGDAGPDAGPADAGVNAGSDAGPQPDSGCLACITDPVPRFGACSAQDFYLAGHFMGGIDSNGLITGAVDSQEDNTFACVVLSGPSWMTEGLPTGVAFAGAGAHHSVPGERSLFVFGGVDWNGKPAETWSRDQQRAEYTCTAWTAWSQLPVARTWIGGTQSQMDGGTIGDGGPFVFSTMVAVGGFLFDGGVTAECDQLDADNYPGTWSQIPSLSVPRGGLGAVEISGSRVMAVGGQGLDDAGTPAVFGTVEVWDPNTDGGWVPLPPLQTPRAFLGVSLDLSGNVWAIGGSTTPVANPTSPDAGATPSAVVEIYVPGASSWVPGPPLPVARWGLSAGLGAPQELCGPSCQAVLVFGGVNPAGTLESAVLGALGDAGWVAY